MQPGRAPPVDYASLAAYLRSLALPARLELLDRLRLPRLVSEVRLAADDGRPLARQTVQAHVDQLMAAGLVAAETVQRGERRLKQYAVSSHGLFHVVEEMRRLATAYAGIGADMDRTTVLTDSAPAPPRPGPHLVLVHGVYDGKVFALEPEADAAVTIGRSPQADIVLDYDRFVSSDHAQIEATDKGSFSVRDAGSRNGTTLNWQPVGTEPATLQPGGIIGIGRSRLVYVPG